MIGLAVEAKRRLAWEDRLDRACLQLEADEGARPALWIYDSLHGPDGYALRDMMMRLAERERLKLFSFGPQIRKGLGAGSGMIRTVRPQWEKAFSARTAARIANAASRCGADLFVVGSSKGTFAKAIAPDAAVWEVQHGLLDPSYFPLRVERFFTRSSTSRTLLKARAPDTILCDLDDDLSPPQVKPGHIARATSMVCFSKNPGGGCTTAELIQFEIAVTKLADRLRLPLWIKLHPRDSRSKLVARHRNLSILKHTKSADSHAGARLVVSSFSTALAAETQAGDLLLNVTLSPANAVTAVEYGWLPTVTIQQLGDATDLAVMERV